MPGSDLNLFIGPDKARELQAMLDWWRRWPGKEGVSTQVIHRGSKIPHPKLGKAHDNIAPRTFGAVDIWSGKPGSETQLTFLTSPVQEFNLLDRTITAGKWVWMFGQYIFGAHFPAEHVWGTVGANVTSGGSAIVTVTRHANGDDPGATVTGYADDTIGTQAIASGKACRLLWDDVNQKYWIASWAC